LSISGFISTLLDYVNLLEKPTFRNMVAISLTYILTDEKVSLVNSPVYEKLLRSFIGFMPLKPNFNIFKEISDYSLERVCTEKMGLLATSQTAGYSSFNEVDLNWVAMAKIQSICSTFRKPIKDIFPFALDKVEEILALASKLCVPTNVLMGYYY